MTEDRLNKKELEAFLDIKKWQEGLEIALRDLLHVKMEEYDREIKKSEDLGEMFALTQSSITALGTVMLTASITMSALLGNNRLGEIFFNNLLEDFKEHSKDAVENREEILSEAVIREKEKTDTLH